MTRDRGDQPPNGSSKRFRTRLKPACSQDRSHSNATISTLTMPAPACH